METISIPEARRLALARAGLLKPEWTAMPAGAKGSGKRARDAAHRVIGRFGYLQLDTVSIAGARSHAILLLSRLAGFDPALAEELLQPGQPLFEYWGHEASWMPMELYPVFGFRRRALRHHPWWGNIVGAHPKEARTLRRRIREEGPLRSLDMEGQGSRGWWDLKIMKKIATALWSSGELAVRERKNFQRTYDLAERVIPGNVLDARVPEREAVPRLLLLALEGHGWATTGTLCRTWRLSNMKEKIDRALRRLQAEGEILPCALIREDGGRTAGWIRPADLELADRLNRIRPGSDHGVLLSPFDPVLWDRDRVRMLFDFDQILEVFKPASRRIYGYYCLPVLAGARLVARVDLKADHQAGRLHVLSARMEHRDGREPARFALHRYASALQLKVTGAQP